MQLGPFIKRKEIWVPTWKGWLLAVLGAAGMFVAIILLIPPFLSPSKPLRAPVLVVEGWLAENGLERALELSKETNYQLVVVTGGPIEKGMSISSYETYANLGASRLRELGFAGTNLVAVPSPKVLKDRTYHSALALRKFLLENTGHRSVDVISSSVHSRRTWLLFRLAGRPEIEVGVISVENPEFDLKRWWRTSYGVRMVLNEMIGYLYAKLAFSPD